jgi:hypothetical protein
VYTKIVKKNIIYLLVILAVSLLPVGLAAAEPLDETKQGIVSQNCITAQSTLQRIGHSDTSARINRGQNYDQILKLFYTMNARVANNNITEPKLADLTKNFEDRLNTFRSQYNEYNDRLKTAIDGDCKNQPNQFYDNLITTRERRSNLNLTITGLNEIIGNYQETVRGLLQ